MRQLIGWHSSALARGRPRAHVAIAATAVMAVLLGRAIAEGDWELPTLVLGTGLLLALLTQPLKRLFICWVALGPLLARWGGVELGRGLPNITFDRSMAGLFILLMVDQLFRARWKEHPPGFSLTLVDLGLGFWVLVYLGSGFLRSQTATSGLFDAFQIAVVPTVVYYATRSVIRTSEDIRKLLQIVALTAIYLTAGALYEQITHTAIGFAGFSAGSGMIRAGLFRSGSFLGAPWTLGYVLLLMLPLVVYAEATAQDRAHRRLYRSAILAAVVGVLVTFIRSVWIALILELFLLAIVFPRWRRIVTAGAIALAIILAGAWPTIGESDAVKMQLGNPINLLGRLELAQVQWIRFLDEPWIGFGGGQGRLATEYDPAHNTWLVMLVELGLVGTVPLLLAVGCMVVQRVRMLRSSRPFAGSRLWSMILLVPFVIVSNSVDLTYFTYELALTFAFLALLACRD